MNRTPNIDDELIIEIVKGMTMFAFQRGNWQKPIEPHELIEYTTAIKTLLANKIKEAELRGRKEHFEEIVPDEGVDEDSKGSFADGYSKAVEDICDAHFARLTQLTNQYKGED